MPSKKTEDESPPAAESPDKAAEPLPAEAEAPAEPTDLGGYYLRAYWKGIPLYTCVTCGYEQAGDEGAVALHARRDHVPRIPVPRPSGLIGPDGKPLPSTRED